MSKVFVLDTEKRPLKPVHPGYARRLLTTGKAAVWRWYPFTIILRRALSETQAEPLRLKIDPGSKTTGLAIVNDVSGEVVWAAEVTHRGEQIHQRLAERCTIRRRRRQHKTRYRKPRFQNRPRKRGWLAPSLASRVVNVQTWVTRLQRLCPLKALSLELVRFDTQLLQNPEISGVEYQQGELAGYEIREYLLEKWQRRCAYCLRTNVSLQVEHIVPRARGGSSRISNLTPACEPCNTAKGTRTALEFGYPEVQAQAKSSLKDVAAVNTTRWELYARLRATGLPVEIGTGGCTKYNRCHQDLPKTHWLNAACVRVSTPEHLRMAQVKPLLITAKGRQRRQMCLVNQYGFPRTRAKKTSVVRGFRTGDLVRAVVPAAHKHVGVHVGRVAVKAVGAFTILTDRGTVPDIRARYCRKLQGSDGYAYQRGGCGFLSIP